MGRTVEGEVAKHEVKEQQPNATVLFIAPHKDSLHLTKHLRQSLESKRTFPSSASSSLEPAGPGAEEL